MEHAIKHTYEFIVGSVARNKLDEWHKNYLSLDVLSFKQGLFLTGRSASLSSVLCTEITTGRGSAHLLEVMSNIEYELIDGLVRREHRRPRRYGRGSTNRSFESILDIDALYTNAQIFG